MIMSRAWHLLLLTLFSTSTLAADLEFATIEEVTVTAPMPDLSISGGLVPELALDDAVIRSLGASSLEELMQELAPEVRSGRGGARAEPAYLVNGRRIANFREIRGYPPEAIERVEIYPEEVALRHGFRPDQKVVNFILAREFRALELETEAGVSSAGDGERAEVEVSRLQLMGARRLNFSLQMEAQRSVREVDREVVVATRSAPSSVQGNMRGADDGAELDPDLSALASTVVTAASLPERSTDAALELKDLLPTANDPLATDQRAARTLLPESQDIELVASFTRPVARQLALSATATWERGRRAADLGIPGYSLDVSPDNPFSPFANPVILDRLDPSQGVLERRDRSDLGAADLTLTGGLGPMQWSWLTEFEYLRRETDTDRGLDASLVKPDADPFTASPLSLPLLREIRTASTASFISELVTNGPIDAFDAGPAQLSASLRFSHFATETEGRQCDTRQRDSAERSLAEFRGSADIPLLASPGLGSLSTNVNFELAELSDFGSLLSYGAGFTWRPINAWRVILSWASEESAPGLAQLADPIVATPNQRVFDFRLGEAVSVTRIEGGNALLSSSQRRVWRSGVRFDPFEAHDLSLNFDYSDSSVTAPIIGFPTPSQEIEEAFAERFERDADGVLIQLDTRPLNVLEARESRIDWGLRYTRRFAGEGRRDGSSPRRSGRGGSRRGDRDGRFALSLQHGWVLEDSLVLAQGFAPIDYVGRSIGDRAEGGAEHEVSLRASFSRDGVGGRARLRWRDGTSSVPDSSGLVALRTSDVAVLDLRAFYLIHAQSDWASRFPWLADARLSIGADNVFAALPEVRDASGAVPAGSSPAELDPLGRVIYVEFRRLIP
jgi:hypothetical protein